MLPARPGSRPPAAPVSRQEKESLVGFALALFLAKGIGLLPKFSGVFAELRGIVENLLLGGSEKRPDLLARFIDHGPDLRPLFFANRLYLRPAGLHDFLHLRFLLVG